MFDFLRPISASIRRGGGDETKRRGRRRGLCFRKLLATCSGGKLHHPPARGADRGSKEEEDEVDRGPLCRLGSMPGLVRDLRIGSGPRGKAEGAGLLRRRRGFSEAFPPLRFPLRLRKRLRRLLRRREGF